MDRLPRRREAPVGLRRESRDAIPSRSWRPTASATKRRATIREIFILPVAACEHQTAECTPRKLEYAGNETQIAWSPDSKRIAFVGQPSRYKNQRLFVVNADGGKAQDILGSWQYEPGQIEWLKDGQIAMVTPTGGSTGLYTIDPTSHKITHGARRTPPGERAVVRQAAAARRLRVDRPDASDRVVRRERRRHRMSASSRRSTTR